MDEQSIPDHTRAELASPVHPRKHGNVGPSRANTNFDQLALHHRRSARKKDAGGRPRGEFVLVIVLILPKHPAPAAMDVTRSNFKQVLQELDGVIRESSFLAVDGEFTGLMDGCDVGPFNTMSEYYEILRRGGMKFLFIQFGLCAFKYDRAAEKWTHRAYNFYIFPKPSNRQSPDLRFLSQSSSIDFLSSNGFDFNKLFREGIPYLPANAEERHRISLTDRHARERDLPPGAAQSRDSPPISIPEEHAAFINKVCLLIEGFIEQGKVADLELPRCTSYLRKLVHQTVEERYATQVRLESRPVDNTRVLYVADVETDEERLKRQEDRRKKELEELEDAVGFSKVIRLLTGSGKMVVGHNMMLDMCHILDQFCSPIPPDYAEFKIMLHDSFPSLLDTKYLSGCSPFKEVIKSNMLSDLHSRLSEEPYTMPVVECESADAGYSLTAEKYHEAGYDAFITGACLIAMANHLDSKSLHPDISTLPLLKPFMNKILMLRIQDFAYMNLVGKDPILPRDHVFHVTFPREWKQMDLVNLFSAISSVYVSWIDSTSAYVALHEREKSRSVMKLVKHSRDYTVTPYHKHRSRAAGQPLAATLVPSSPTTAKLKRLSTERLQEAEKPPQPPPELNLKRKRPVGPPKDETVARTYTVLQITAYECLWLVLFMLVAISLGWLLRPVESPPGVPVSDA